MLNPFTARLLVVVALFSGSITGAMAADRNLIQTLYHSDFDEVGDGGQPRFTLDGEVGLLSASGNTNANSLKAALHSEHETAKWNNNYFAEMLYKQSKTENDDGETTSEVTAQRFFGYAQFDYKLMTRGQRTFMYADNENDRFNGYEYRASLAAGWSQRLWNEDESSFRYSVGPGYAFVAVEEGTESNVNNGLIARASGEYQYQWNTGAQLRQFMSAEIGADNIKTRSVTALSANLFDSLAMKLAFNLAYETEPLEDVKSVNTETTVSVVYRFF